MEAEIVLLGAERTMWKSWEGNSKSNPEKNIWKAKSLWPVVAPVGSRGGHGKPSASPGAILGGVAMI